MEHCASPDLNGYKAAGAQTLSASQLNCVSWLGVASQNEWGKKDVVGRRRQQIGGIEMEKKKRKEKSFLSFPVFRLYLLTIPLSDQ